MGYLLRQLAVAGLAGNAIRPSRSTYAGVMAFFAGWMTSELAPQLFAASTLDTALELAHKDHSRAKVLLGLANLAALGYLVKQSHESQHAFDAGLAEELGASYRAELAALHPDLEWRTPVARLARPFKIQHPEVEVQRNIAFAPEFGRRGLLDVYRHVDARPNAPMLLQVHGGAWMTGSKDHQGLPLMTHLASRGWVCFAINYRLAPRSAFPAQIIDVKRAIAWVKQHAGDYGADPAFLAITGGSAGGHLTALAALTPNDPDYQPGFEDADTSVQAAVPFYGVYDLAGQTGRSSVWMRDSFLAPRVFQLDPSEDLEPFEHASPLTRVRKDAPPFYVIHGTNDTMVPISQARAFVKALKEVSDNPVAYTELVGAQHAFDLFPSLRSQHSVRSVERFLTHCLEAARRHLPPDQELTDQLTE